MSTEIKIGSRVRQLRESKQMTAEQLAEQSHCPIDQIRQIEEGALVPSLTPLMEISRALGVRLGTLLDDDPIEGPVIFKSTQSPNVIRFSGKDPKAINSKGNGVRLTRLQVFGQEHFSFYPD